MKRIPPVRLIFAAAGLLAVLTGALSGAAFGAWSYSGMTMLLLALVPSAKKSAPRKQPLSVAPVPGRWPMAVLIAVLAVTAAVSVWLGVSEPLMMSSQRVPMQGSDSLTAGEETQLLPDWVFTGSFRLKLSGSAGAQAEIIQAGSGETVTIGDDGTLETEQPVTGWTSEITVRCLSGEIRLEDWAATSDIHWPKLLGWLCALWGTVGAVWFLARKRLDSAAFVLALGLGCALVMAKVITVPHGWDEAIHRTHTMRMAGEGITDAGDYIRRFSVWYFGYLSAAIGTALGKLFGLPLQVIWRLGSLTAALGYALLLKAAVRHVPKYRLTVLALGCVPTCVYIAGCYTYDGVVIGCALLFMSLLAEAVCEKKPLGAGRMLLLTAPLVLAVLTKPVYALLLPMLFWLPEECVGGRRNRVLLRCWAVLMTVWCFVCLVLPGAYDNVSSGDSRFADTDSAAQVQFILSHPLDFLRVMGAYLLKEMPFNYVDAPLYLLGSYSGIRKLGRILTLILLAVCPLAGASDEKAPSMLTARRRIGLFLLSLLPVCVLTVTQYCVSTPVGADQVLGMQERYTLPVWLLFALALMLPEKLRRRFSRWTPALQAAVVLALAVSCMHCMRWLVLPIWWN